MENANFILPGSNRVWRSPTVVVSTENLSEEEWLEYRRLGIGGSDVAACMGLSPFITIRDLWRDKCGLVPLIKDENNRLAKEVGHRLESLVAEEFARQTGMSVFKLKKMLRHPEYDFMQADVDYFCVNAQGQIFVLEIKTSHSRNRFMWANNTIPFHVDRQGRHYMCVCDLDGCYFACLFDNSEADLEIRFIKRDFEVENEMVLDERFFWDFVEEGIEPPYLEEPDKVLESIRRFYGPADLSLSGIQLDYSWYETLRQIEELKRQKSDLDAASRAVNTEIQRLYAPIVDIMGKGTEAIVTSGSRSIGVSYKPTARQIITKENMLRLQVNHPEIFAQYATTSEGRAFKILDKLSA